MPTIGSSTFRTLLNIGASSIAGPAGPTGPTGSTGATGGIGPTGPTGFGITGIVFYSRDSVSITLTDNSSIIVTGLSGPSPSEKDFSQANSNRIYGSTGHGIYSIGGVCGFGYLPVPSIGGYDPDTASFKFAPFTGGAGISFTPDNTNKNIVLAVTGVTTSLQNGAIIGVSGTIGIPFYSSSNNLIFKYESNTPGITTIDLATGILGSAFTSLSSTNLNATGTNVLSNLSNQDIVIDQFYNDPGTGKWIAKQSIKVSDSNFNHTSATFSFSAEVFDNSLGITFPERMYGSCCYCHDDDSETKEKRCLDYAPKKLCDKLGGSFSQEVLCSNRTDTSICEGTVSVSKRACCTCGTVGINPTPSCTGDLTEDQCRSLGFVYHTNRSCSEVVCSNENLQCSPGFFFY